MYFSELDGQDYLYVNESQFGVAFGVNFVPTSNPFCVKTYEVNDISTSIIETGFNNSMISLFPNPTNNEIRISSLSGQLFTRLEIYSLDGKILQAYQLNAESHSLPINDMKGGVYLMKTFTKDGQQYISKLMVEN